MPMGESADGLEKGAEILACLHGGHGRGFLAEDVPAAAAVVLFHRSILLSKRGLLDPLAIKADFNSTPTRITRDAEFRIVQSNSIRKRLEFMIFNCPARFYG